jgi:phosphatidylserine decarboxylase
MRIHKEGYLSIVVVLVIMLLFAYVTNIYLSTIYAIPFYLIYFIFWAFIVSFFRYPKREIIKNNQQVIAPADGTIVAIEEIDEQEYFKDRRIQVSIFMSPLNVHANWYPISGEISYMKYHPGKHFIAHKPKSSIENERSTVVVKRENGTEVMFRQIAGAVARRVVCYSRKGNKAEQGDNMGFIKFGSRVDLILPVGTKIKVNLEDKTVAKNTIIAEL